MSSLGKGLASAALGALLQSRGYKVRLRKLDPYLNVDPGTMSPYQHGEVYVTDDGAETDLDLGHYERFTGVSAAQTDNITTGRIYSNIIAKERRGDYLGATVQVIPHVTNEIKDFIGSDAGNVDFVLCEVGGTVGDIEGLPFFEALRQFSQEQPRNNTCFLHVTLLPFIKAAGEMKTKPTQIASKNYARLVFSLIFYSAAQTGKSILVIARKSRALRMSAKAQSYKALMPNRFMMCLWLIMKKVSTAKSSPILVSRIRPMQTCPNGSKFQTRCIILKMAR